MLCSNLKAFLEIKKGDSIRIFGYQETGDRKEFYCDSVEVFKSKYFENPIENKQVWQLMPNI